MKGRGGLVGEVSGGGGEGGVYERQTVGPKFFAHVRLCIYMSGVRFVFGSDVRIHCPLGQLLRPKPGIDSV